MSKISRRVTWGCLAAAGAIGTAALTASAGPAMAATSACPNGAACSNAVVHISVGISFAFNGSNTFTLTPGVTSTSAVQFTVSTNNTHGYSLSLSGTDPTTPGGAFFPAGDLQYKTFLSGTGEVDQGIASLTNASATVFSKPSPTSGDNFSQDWVASNVPVTQSPGDYVSTLSYVASVNP